MHDNERMQEVKDALQVIVDHADEKALNHAANYAKYGLTITDPVELNVQCIYVLGNITYWRNPVAKDVRKILKKYTTSKR